MTNEKNRRRENRVRVLWKAQIKDESRAGPAIVRNISLSGLYFETPLTCALQSKITLEADIDYFGRTHALRLDCEVMRCTSTETPKIQGYGASFVRLGKENLSLLLPIIADLWIAQGGQTAKSSQQSSR